MNNEIKNLIKLHKEKKAELDAKISEYREKGLSGTNSTIFPELAFCLFTPQSKAKTCWQAVEKLNAKKLLINGKHGEISDILGTTGVRFKNNKAKYLIEARNILNKDFLKFIKSFKTIFEAREWLVANIKGMAYKEAGHFLRNIGYGSEIAILDRHILKNLKKLGVIKDVPKTINKKTYMEIENKMTMFSKKYKIPLDHLDLLLWYKETGEFFK